MQINFGTRVEGGKKKLLSAKITMSSRWTPNGQSAGEGERAVGSIAVHFAKVLYLYNLNFTQSHIDCITESCWAKLTLTHSLPLFPSCFLFCRSITQIAEIPQIMWIFRGQVPKGLDPYCNSCFSSSSYSATFAVLAEPYVRFLRNSAIW